MLKSKICLGGIPLETRSGDNSSLCSGAGDPWDGTEGYLGTAGGGSLSDKKGPGKERGHGAWLTLDILDGKSLVDHLHQCL